MQISPDFTVNNLNLNEAQEYAALLLPVGLNKISLPESHQRGELDKAFTSLKVNEQTGMLIKEQAGSLHNHIIMELKLNNGS